jgi:uncharacterized damage-inducible protein DinB
MITQVLIEVFARDLDKLSEEIKQYADDASLWKVKDGINNSGGNLCLHIAGNLQHYIGAVLGNSGYVRNRNAEFSIKDITRQKLLEEIEETKSVVTDTLEQVSKTDLQQDYPHQLGDEVKTTEFFLVHLATHLNYHLGQLNYHRRLLGHLS